MHLTMPKQVHFHNNTSTANTAIEQKLREDDETFVVSKIVTVENDNITNNVKSIPTTRGPKIVAHPYSNMARINRIGTNNQIPLDFTPM